MFIISHRSAVEFWRLTRQYRLPRQGMKRWLSKPDFAIDAIDSGALFAFDRLAHVPETSKADAYVTLDPLFANHTMQPLGKRKIAQVLAQSSCPTRENLALAMNDCGVLQLQTHPLHVLVGNNNMHVRDDLTVKHSCLVPLPAGALIPVSPDVYVCSPETAFVQMANEIARPNLVRLGHELCGGYTLAPNLARGFADCYPVTTPDKLKRTIETLGRMHGCKKARIAVKRVRANCASPSEADGLVIMCFPRNEGGLAVPYPLVNEWIPVDSSNCRWREDGYYCDFAWIGARLLVECDGREGHSDDESRIWDARKQRALTLEGYTVIRIVNSQLRSWTAMNAIGNDILHLLGVSRQTEPVDYPAKRRKLHKQLFK